MNEGRRRRELDSISDALLHACEQYLRGFEEHANNARMDQLADSIQQLFKQRIRSGDRLPFPNAEAIPTRQLVIGDEVYASQFLDWVASLHRELKMRTVSRYAQG
jgi:predicted metalloprotease with PDZ domain